jgi:hypothetical protein
LRSGSSSRDIFAELLGVSAPPVAMQAASMRGADDGGGVSADAGGAAAAAEAAAAAAPARASIKAASPRVEEVGGDSAAASGIR